MLPLPITPADALAHIVAPALAELPARMDTPEARVMCLAAMGVESNLAHRDQLERDGRDTVTGPALGLGQFERGGGVHGVLNHAASRPHVLAACAKRGIDPSTRDLWLALEHDDVLAAILVRLLLWTDPSPLPAIGHMWNAYAYYLRNWRPGKPDAKRWPKHYIAAVEAVTA